MTMTTYLKKLAHLLTAAATLFAFSIVPSYADGGAYERGHGGGHIKSGRVGKKDFHRARHFNHSKRKHHYKQRHHHAKHGKHFAKHRKHHRGYRHHKGFRHHKGYGHRRHHKGHGGAVAAGIIGLTAGAIIASSIHKQKKYKSHNRHVHVNNNVHGGYQPFSRAWYRACAKKYKSFNPETGRYLTYSGRYKLCRI